MRGSRSTKLVTGFPIHFDTLGIDQLPSRTVGTDIPDIYANAFNADVRLSVREWLAR